MRARSFHVLLLLTSTLVVRLLVLVLGWENLADDPDAYRAIARSLSQFGVYGVASSDPPAAPAPSVVPVEQADLGESPLASADLKLQPPAPTAYRPPLYPLLLAVVDLIPGEIRWGIAALHLLLGVSTVWNVYRLAAAWGLQRGCFLPAWFVALDPLLLNQASLVMTETLAAWLTSLLLFVLHRWRDTNTTRWLLVVGVAFGVAMLARPTFVAWLAPWLLMHVLWPSPQATDAWRRRLGQAFAIGLFATLMLLPWALRNQTVLYPAGFRWQKDARPVIATTHGGYTLLLGNNDSFYRHLRKAERGEVWGVEANGFQARLRGLQAATDETLQARYPELYEQASAAASIPPATRTEAQTEALRKLQAAAEPVQDRLAYAAAVEAMEANPQAALWASLDRVRQLWTPLSSQRSTQESSLRRFARYVVAVWYSGLYLLTIVALFHKRDQLTAAPARDALLFCIGLTLLHTLFWCNFRMRAPLIPITALLAGVGAEFIWRQIGCFRIRKLPRS